MTSRSITSISAGAQLAELLLEALQRGRIAVQKAVETAVEPEHALVALPQGHVHQAVVGAGQEHGLVHENGLAAAPGHRGTAPGVPEAAQKLDA